MDKFRQDDDLQFRHATNSPNAMRSKSRSTRNDWRAYLLPGAMMVCVLIAFLSRHATKFGTAHRLVQALKYDKRSQVDHLLQQSIPHVKCNDSDLGRGFFYPIHLAASLQNEKVVEKLIKDGANVNEPDAKGETPIIWLFRRPNLMDPGPTERCLDLLLAHGADPRRFSADSHVTPLHEATWLTGVGCTVKLLEHGAAVNAMNFSGSTPLHEACAAPYDSPALPQVVEALMEAGADPILINHCGKTPADVARDLKRFALVELIKKHEDKRRKEAQN